MVKHHGQFQKHVHVLHADCDFKEICVTHVHELHCQKLLMYTEDKNPFLYSFFKLSTDKSMIKKLFITLLKLLLHRLQIFETRKTDVFPFILSLKVNSFSSHVMHYVYMCVLWCKCTTHIVHLTSKEMKYILFRREHDGTWKKKKCMNELLMKWILNNVCLSPVYYVRFIYFLIEVISALILFKPHHHICSVKTL